MTGTVKFYHLDKGWGFVTDAAGVDYFVHKDNIDGKPILYRGQTVVFEKIQTTNGNMAVEVKIKEVLKTDESKSIDQKCS